MKNLKLDFFKISIVIILLGFLFVFYQFSENGRFQISGESSRIIDTRTGAVYRFGLAEPISKPLPK